MKVAVLMPAYNAERYVGEALASLLGQDGAEVLNIIVVDDGSRDGTVAVIEKVAAERGQVRLIRAAHAGVTKARNLALDAVAPDAELVGFLDADDVWPEGRLKRDLELFADNAALDVVYGPMLTFLSPEWERKREDDEPEALEIRGINLGGGMFRSSRVAMVGRFDENLTQGEDMDFLLRLFETRPNYLILDEVRVHYRRHAGNMTKQVAARNAGLHKLLAKSIVRRRKLGDFRYPRGLFDGSNFKKMPRDW